MRTILFRGKRAGSGSKEWVKGLLKSDVTGEVFITKGNPLVDVPVNAETIGQFIGLVDQKGLPIFEGDIVRDTKDNQQNGIICYVEWNAQICGFCLMYERMDRLLGFRNRGSGGTTFDPYLEVVGNIYDNMDLLRKPIIEAPSK
jgi:uncharacterized phage protein (TIGR01671 family)